ncbi:MAG TPA: hypothetical protein VK846_09760 [Candidatus Limnocylindria bacterium]|nr:hypothetical protein [Candidatus Limnocylindria bacterium]
MKRWLIIATSLVAVGWCLYALAGHPVSDALALRFGGSITKLGEGKISSPSDFVYRRLFEAMFLFTLLYAWVVAHALIVQTAKRFCRLGRFAWIAQALLVFACFNLWLAQAKQTALFWGVMWQGLQTSNLTRFHLKRILMEESSVPMRAALMGSSQTRAQINEELLNSLLGTKLRTIDLNFPGSKAYDDFLLQPLVARTRPDYIIIYVSEADFYSGSASEVIPNFLTWTDLPDLVARGGTTFIPPERVASGLLGSVLPLFHLRQVFAQRVLGPEIAQLKQSQHNAAITNDAAPVAPHRPTFVRNEESRFQQRAMEDFVIRCQRSREKVIVLAGQVNPLFSRTMESGIREEMLSTLRALAAKYSNVTLVENLPAQMPENYDDMTHVNVAAQEHFTRFLAAWLDQRLAASPEIPR